MCTSFIKATEDNCFIAMNFDNNGMKYNINTRKKDWFIVYVEIGKIKAPSFGIHKSDVFFNNQMVDDCEKGKYRRGKGVVHSTRFLNEIIDDNIHVDDLDRYLQNTEIVNVPDFSTHNMVCGTQNDVWLIEPGRGTIHEILKPSEYKLMTNFSLVDHESTTCDRYMTANELLTNTSSMCVEKAFEILNAVKQSSGEWITDFSMVYDKARKTVYYCKDRDFTNIESDIFQ